MLYIVATPIGNLEDLTFRALKVLKEVDFILAEDSRKAVNLLRHLGIEKPVETFFEHNERMKVPGIIERLSRGESAALISEAGAPTISDPGYCLVRECKGKNISVTALPGASSVINALMLSAAPRDRFVFLGFLPRKHNERKKLMEKVDQWGLTAVFFESPHRILSSLQDIAEIMEVARKQKEEADAEQKAEIEKKVALTEKLNM